MMKKLFWLSCIAAVLSLPLYAADMQYTRTDATPDHQYKQRYKMAPKVLMYPEVQYKYGLFQNFLGIYVDRPLFYDRTLRYPAGTFAYITEESYFRDIAIMKEYGFDGAGSLAMGIFKLYEQVNGFLKNDPARAKGHLEFPQFAFGEMGSFSACDKQLAMAKKVLAIALKSPHAPRVNGRVLVTTYNSAYIKPENMTDFLAKLRKEFGDTFLVTGGIPIEHADRIEFEKTGKWSADTQEKYKKWMQDILKIFDGIQIPLMTRTHELNYMTRSDTGIYDQYLAPMVAEIQTKKEFRNKLFGAVVIHGYINHMSAVTHGEFGTETLRCQMDRLVKMDPDFIVFFEWNEFNENTCFQPTLFNAMSLQRIIRYYSDLLKGNPLAPNKGDDQSIPPLIVSAREAYRIGEPMRIELLNVPDTRNGEKYQVQLKLVDSDGKEYGRFPKEEFDRSKMRAVTYALPTEQFSMRSVIRPVATVTNASGKEMVFDQLQSFRFAPTVNTNYKETRQPLRDLIPPKKANFQVKARNNGTYEIQGEFEAEEPLASLEVTDHGREVFAVDPSNEFDREKNWIVVGSIPAKHGGNHDLQFQVTNAPGWKFRPWEQANISFGTWKQNGDTVRSRTLLWVALNQFILTIPKTALNAEITATVSGESHTLKLADLLKNKKFGQLYKTSRIDWEMYSELPDIPPQLNRNAAGFKTTVESFHKYPAFQMRAVTKSGKIWRGKLVIPNPIPQEKENLNIYSESTGKITGVEVPTALVPKLSYVLDPASGAVLKNSFDPNFDGQLGGGFVYDEAAHVMPLPKNESYAPRYEKDEKGNDVLRFRGHTYINFPKETFPRGSFTLNFEVKPDGGDQTYVLFRHFSWILGSITVYVKYDRLHVAFGDKELKVHAFASGYELKPGEWSDVTIAFNQKELTFKVNGKSRTYKVTKPIVPLYFKPAMFGGHTKAEFGLPDKAKFYSGLLRKFEIHHNAE